MKILFLFLFFLLIAFNSNADTKIQAFDSKEISLPAGCIFKVGKDENSFQCTLNGGKDGSVFFRSPAEAKQAEKQMLYNIENRVLNDEGMHFDVETFKDTDGLQHFKIIAQVNGRAVHHYEICDTDACVGATSRELKFVRFIISQISEKSLYE